MGTNLEPLAEKHRTPVIDIYNYYIDNGYSAYLDRNVPYEFFDLFLGMMRGYPSAAILAPDGTTVGFAYLRPYNPLPAFAGAAEFTCFIRPEFTGKGMGSDALKYLEEKARPMNITSLLASISSRNLKSVVFHVKNGFREWGRLEKIGKKFDCEFDLIWMRKDL